jgi:molybdenum cofactor cytidylyltransferase
MGEAPRITAIVLAAGRSTRMGASNKLLMRWRGKPLVAHAVEQLLASSVTTVVVVTGYQEDQVRAALSDLSVTYVSNPRFAEGLSTSLIAGIAAVPSDADGAMVALGDMPRIDAALIDSLITAFRPAEGRAICLPVFAGKWGNPVLWARRYLDDMAELSGDVGAKGLLQANLNAICEVAATSDAILADIDTPEAFAALVR